jgi:hypothetical protein
MVAAKVSSKQARLSARMLPFASLAVWLLTFTLSAICLKTRKSIATIALSRAVRNRRAADPLEEHRGKRDTCRLRTQRTRTFSACATPVERRRDAPRTGEPIGQKGGCAGIGPRGDSAACRRCLKPIPAAGACRRCLPRRLSPTRRTKAAATVAPTEPSARPSSLFVRFIIARELQGELKRVGCDPGNTDGDWNAPSRRALENFNKHAGTKLDVRVANLNALGVIRSRMSRICPLACDRGSFRAIVAWKLKRRAAGGTQVAIV